MKRVLFLLGLTSLVVASACESNDFPAGSSGAAGSSGSPGGADGGTSPTGVQGNDTGGGGASGSDPGELPAPPTDKIDLSNESVQAMGQTRTFVLAVPKNYDAARKYPLIMVFHGDGGSGTVVRSQFPIDTESGYDAIVAYPNSNGGASWDLYTPEASNADDAFVSAIVTSLAARFSVDTTHVFGSGYSAGAFFIEQLACRRTGFFRGIAANSGGAPSEPIDPAASYWKPDYTKCAHQTGGVPALIFHGTADDIVATSSGDFSAQYWAYLDGCDESPDHRIATSPSPCKKHAACPVDKPVIYCEIPNLGHVIWSQAVKTSWAFFQSL